MFIFTINFFLPTYGSGFAAVVAPNVVEAMRLAAGTEDGWMLNSPSVEVSTIKRGFLARCDHEGANGVDGEVTYTDAWTADYSDVTWECHDCPTTWKGDNTPEPSATKAGFAAYCANLRVDYSDGYAE